MSAEVENQKFQVFLKFSGPGMQHWFSEDARFGSAQTCSRFFEISFKLTETRKTSLHLF